MTSIDNNFRWLQIAWKDNRDLEKIRQTGTFQWLLLLDKNDLISIDYQK